MFKTQDDKSSRSLQFHIAKMTGHRACRIIDRSPGGIRVNHLFTTKSLLMQGLYISLGPVNLSRVSFAFQPVGIIERAAPRPEMEHHHLVCSL